MNPLLSLRVTLETKKSIQIYGLSCSRWSLAMTIMCLFLLTNTANAGESGYCDTANNTIELNKCGKIYWKREDTALQIIYDDAIEELKTEDNESPIIGPSRTGSRENKLREAQRAWVKFRDLHCQSETLITGGGGTISGQIEFGCLTAITKERALEIQKLLNFSWEN
jgi:uncharacterized protein YecT (DUF1311 family)